MGPTGVSAPSILIASDSPADAELVKTLLEDDFPNVALSLEADKAVGDFQRLRPSVLILAFKDLQRSEDHYLGLDRSGDKGATQPHRTVVLCTRESVKQAYERCRNGLFDDYVLFWPVTHDVPRLLMSVYRASDELSSLASAAAESAAVEAQLERLVELEGLLAAQLARGDEYAAAAGHALTGAEREISMALAGLAERMRKSTSASGSHDVREALGKMIDLCNTATVSPHLQQVSQSLEPLKSWASGVQEAMAPFIGAARDLGTLATRRRSHILVVDDDEFQRKLTSRILESEGYQVSVAATGREALDALSDAPHDLVLIDYLMPEMNGIEVLEHLKAEPKCAEIPAIMITGNSERDVVLKSRALGVRDFMVKPLTRDALLAKVSRALR